LSAQSFHVPLSMASAGKVAAVEQGLDLPTILLVEDDELIQAMVEEALTEGGFRVAIAASVEEAVALLKGDKPAHRALVTDIHLGGKMSGWDIARIAREIDPALPVVYTTGDAAEEWPSKGVPQSVLLTKPFAPAQLVTAVAQLLNAGAQTTTMS
jgi:CheY-like chemotaxis protein